MAPRNRSYSYTQYQGFATQNGVVIGQGHKAYEAGGCSDQTGPGDCAPLTINKWMYNGGRIDKHTRSSSFGDLFFNYLADVLLQESNFPHATISSSWSNTAAATSAAARTNPSRPYVDVPVALLELGDVVRLVRTEGRSIIHRAASANIKYQFGVAPMVGDLVKLLDFQEQVARRVKEIERLASPRGLRRTVNVDEVLVRGTTSKTCQSVYRLINRTFTYTTRLTVKAHCRWKPTVSVASLAGSAKMRALARRAVLGLTVDSSTAWELLPWSWLIDWGTNIGTFLKANRNIIPAQLTGVHVMRHTRTTYTCNPYSAIAQPGDHPVTMSPIYFERNTKLRQPSFVAPTAHFPFLSGRQVGILASLAVLRRR